MKADEKHIENIVEWFELVCKGIRAEYEQGASHRKLETDKRTLEKELRQFVK